MLIKMSNTSSKKTTVATMNSNPTAVFEFFQQKFKNYDRTEHTAVVSKFKKCIETPIAIVVISKMYFYK